MRKHVQLTESKTRIVTPRALFHSITVTMIMSRQSEPMTPVFYQELQLAKLLALVKDNKVMYVLLSSFEECYYIGASRRKGSGIMCGFSRS